EHLFVTIRQNFTLAREAEITLECAPGTLSSSMASCLAGCGVNRVSLGVQSFSDREAALVGRLHRRETVLQDIGRLREAGISNINIDLIAGLPCQTAASWQDSIAELIQAGVPHASIYMLEIDEDSRLGRERIAGGERYHARSLPDDDLAADFYLMASTRLEGEGIEQYEISNFARPGFQSMHNLKYWRRQPYLGFGLDAHSMLPAEGSAGAVRFANPDSLETYLTHAPAERSYVSPQAALEEAFFLGLRLREGVDLGRMGAVYGRAAVTGFLPIVDELRELGLLEGPAAMIRLTEQGRLLSNEVFARFLGSA
ncbi:MAG: coproporphyrinogen III oxidase family protein, partial [Acidobacteria bacterium]|nr:coproporphyrinogen III oxidase family protein [Acidobacteriota bacterium]